MANTRLRAETHENGEVQLYERNRDPCAQSPFTTLNLDLNGIPVYMWVKEDTVFFKTEKGEIILELNITRS